MAAGDFVARAYWVPAERVLVAGVYLWQPHNTTVPCYVQMDQAAAELGDAAPAGCLELTDL